MEKRSLRTMLTLLLLLPFAAIGQVTLVDQTTGNPFTSTLICSGGSATDPLLTLTATVSPAIANCNTTLDVEVIDPATATLLSTVSLPNATIATTGTRTTITWNLRIGDNAITSSPGGVDWFNRGDFEYRFKGTYVDAGTNVHNFFSPVFFIQEGNNPQVRITAAGATVAPGDWFLKNNFTILKGCVSNDPRIRVRPTQCGNDGFRILVTEVDLATGNWVGPQVNKLLTPSEITSLLSSSGIAINGITDGTNTITLTPGKLYSIATVYVGQTQWKITYANMMYKDGSWDLVMHDNASDLGFEPVDKWDNNVFNSADLWNKLSTTGSPGTIDNEPPTFVTVAGNTNKMMVKVTNAGCSTSTASNLRLFWTRARTDEIWNSHWLYDITTMNYTTNAAFGTTHLPLGSEITISGATMASPYNTTSAPYIIPAISAGASYSIPFASAVDWFPPNPLWYDATSGSMTGSGHPVVCLLARINEASSINDPITWEPSAMSLKILPYVKNNNNIVTRNTYVVAQSGFLVIPTGTNWHYGFGTVLVNNPDLTPRTVRLCTDLIPDGVTTGTFNTYGSMEIGTTTGLYNAWLAGGAVATNVVPATPTLFTVTSGTHACLENITLPPGFSEQVGIRFNYNCNTLPAEPVQYSYSLSQSSGADETLLVGSNAVYIADVPSVAPAGVNGCAMAKSSTGIANVASQNGLYLYPNPTSGNVDVSIDSKDFKAVTINVYDLTGRIVMSQQVDEAKTTISVDASKLAAGTYILKINDVSGVTMQARFVKN